MLTVLVSAPKAFEQAIVTTFAPETRLTDAGDVAALPLAVQVTGAVPPLVQVTLAVFDETVELSVGAVMLTTGAVPRLIAMLLVFEPLALVQTTVTVLAPTARLTVAGEVAGEPFTVQLIGCEPVAVQATEAVAPVTLELFAGPVIVTVGGEVAATVNVLVLTTAAPPPVGAADTVSVCVPAPSEREFIGLVHAVAVAESYLQVTVPAPPPVSVNNPTTGAGTVLPSAG